MSSTEPIMEFTGDFSEPSASGRPWADVLEVLTDSEMFWVSTVRTDGRPHVVPMPAVWLDGVLYFCTGAAEQKAVNLRSNAQCALSAGPNHYREGLDVVVEGSAARVTGRERLEPLAALWKAKLDWDFDVADDGFRDPHSPTGEVLVFGVAPVKVLAFGKSPYSQTRYRFAD